MTKDEAHPAFAGYTPHMRSPANAGAFLQWSQESPADFSAGLHVLIRRHLLSHTVTHAVPSAQKSLTSVFEMGTGVTSLR